LPLAAFTRAEAALCAAFCAGLRALRAGDFFIACREIFERDLVDALAITSCIAILAG
jgi:hypothetical protein